MYLFIIPTYFIERQNKSNFGLMTWCTKEPHGHDKMIENLNQQKTNNSNLPLLALL